jgi:hypothetical protein
MFESFFSYQYINIKFERQGKTGLPNERVQIEG